LAAERAVGSIEAMNRATASAHGVLIAAAAVLAGCHCACPVAVSAPIDMPRSAAAPGPRDGMDAEEIWYHDHYNRVTAIQVETGKATYYDESLAGNLTASGEVFDPSRFTAAHRGLPFGTVVRVVRLDTGAHTYVKINDRGPFGENARIIDLAKAAASRLHMLRAGVVPVRVEVLRVGDGRYHRTAQR
jgi:rare lipoprotein A